MTDESIISLTYPGTRNLYTVNEKYKYLEQWVGFCQDFAELCVCLYETTDSGALDFSNSRASITFTL
jgi:hypothetical protein